MRIYLAGRYDRRSEIAVYAAELRSLGHVVVSRWHDGGYEDDPDGTLALACERAWVVTGGYPTAAAPFAEQDLEDLDAADTAVFLTEPGGDFQVAASAARGGRHVELGIAYAWAKRVIVVGPRENVFCTLPGVEVFDSWEGARDVLAAEAAA